MYIAIVSNVSDVNNVSIVGNVSIVKYMDLPIKIKTKNKKKNRFITWRVALDQPKQHTDDAIWIVIPYKDQDAAVSVKRQLRDLSSKVQKTIQPMFTNRKLKQDLSLCQPKPNIVTQQCVVYLFKCDLCDAGYVGYTKGRLHTRVAGHRQKASSIYKHYSKEHNTAVPTNFLARFSVTKKCTNKFDCLVNEMRCIQDLKPALNVQSDSLRAKVFM